jgi:hypothetical protein
VGDNVKLMVQLAPDAKLDPQSLVSPKSLDVGMSEMLSVVMPYLLSVTTCGVLAVTADRGRFAAPSRLSQ